MIIYDDDGIGHKVVPMSVIEDIKAEILGLMSHDDYMVDGFNVLEIIDKHISGDMRGDADNEDKQ